MKTYIIHNLKHGPTSNYDDPARVIELLDKNPASTRLSFDGVYDSVFRRRDDVIRRCTHPPILFVVGSTVGGDNAFDDGQPRELFCDWAQLIELAEDYGCVFGWHTWTHRDLTTLTDNEVLNEITPPKWLRPWYFAYPYGSFDERTMSAVAQCGHYRAAYATVNGTHNRWARQRHHVPVPAPTPFLDNITNPL